MSIAVATYNIHSCVEGDMRIIATHLGLLSGERRLQMRKLLALLMGSGVEPTVLLSDLNEWFL